MLIVYYPFLTRTTQHPILAALGKVGTISEYALFPHPEEWAVLRRMQSCTRRREWMASRAALRALVALTASADRPLDAKIVKDRYGRPTVRVVKQGICHDIGCSISHKGGRVAVCLAEDGVTAVGIDIETVSERPVRLARAFIHEKDCAAGIEDAKRRYTLLWSCKEAASKVLGLGLLVDYKKMVVVVDDAGRIRIDFNGQVEMEGTVVHLEDAVVVCCRSCRPLMKRNALSA